MGMKKNLLAAAAGFAGGYVTSAMANKDKKEDEEINRIIAEGLGEFAAPQPEQPIPAGAIDESGAKGPTGSNAVVQNLGGGAPQGLINQRRPTAQPGNNVMPITGNGNQLPVAPQTAPQGQPPAGGAPDNVAQFKPKSAGATERLNSTVHKLMAKGKKGRAAAVELLTTNETLRKYAYQDSMRRSRPLIQAWVMAGDHTALQAAMNEMFPDGKEYEVIPAEDGKYKVKVDGEDIGQEFTADELTMQAAQALQSEEAYMESVISNIQSAKERKQKLEDEERKYQRERSDKLTDEQRAEQAEIRKEQRGLINERAKKNQYRPLTAEERETYGLPEDTPMQIDSEGKLVPVNLKDATGGGDTADIKNVNRLLEKGIFKEEKDAWNFIKQGKTASDVRGFATSLLKYQSENGPFAGEPGHLTPSQAYEEAKKIVSGSATDAGGSDDDSADQGTTSSDEPKAINTQEEYDALPSGAIYIDPDDNKKYRKP